MQLTLATRGSELALAQAKAVAAALEQLGCACRLEIITTSGDRNLHQPLPEIGGKGLFTKEVDQAVLEGRAQAAVHSLKDMPLEEEPGLVLAAVPERYSDRDVLVLNTALPDLARFTALPDKSADVLQQAFDILQHAQREIGCGSPRRQTQLLERFPQARLCGVRGNIGTRLRKMREHGWGGVVMAEAALLRLELAAQTAYLPLPILPAAGQGALGIRARADDPVTLQLLARLEDPASRQRAEAERAFLLAIGGGCHTPAGIRTRLQDGRLKLEAALFDPRETAGMKSYRAEEEVTVEEAARTGQRLGRKLADAASL